MVGREISPTEIGKHAKFIKNAQEDMSTMDVLVCGRCLTVFHFVEEFKQHKLKNCFKENNNVRECNDTKPKIWAFLLWKATQLTNNKDNNINSPNSWALYQTWVKMDESLRETWIVAGKTIQSFAKVSQGSLQEMPVKITKTVVNNNADGISPGRKPLAQTKPQVANLKPPVKLNVSNKSTADSENEASPLKSPLANNALPKVVKKPLPVAQLPTKPVIVNSTPIVTAPAPTPVVAPPPVAPAVATITKPVTRRAKRTIPNSEDTIEENVEKIVAKRFNPRRRMHEYLVKWENRAVEQNTWEPASHLENVPHLLETFEKQLARQKETRAAIQAKQQSGTATTSLVTKPAELKIATKDSPLQQQSSPMDSQKSAQSVSPSERPSRTSKTKAMDQVKQWVAGTSTTSSADSPNSELASHQNENDKDWAVNTSTGSVQMGGQKRKLDDSDYNEADLDDMPQTTTSTMEDLEEDLIPSHTLKRMKYGNSVSVEVKTKAEPPKQIKVNGTSTTRNDSQSNSAEVIITQDTNASGVVKKPGFSGTSANNKTEAQVRVLSKGESAVSNSGIVRVGSSNDISATSSPTPSTQATAIGDSKPALVTRTQHVRSVPASGGRSTPTQQGRQVVQQQIVRTPGGTTIQRKTISSSNSTGIQRSIGGGMQSRTMSQTSPSSGRMIIPRQGGVPSNAHRMGQQQKAVTPEQKILQLSKSGDLKVTKKVMTREDVVAQRQQHQQLQQRQRQQSQVHIQKVQQLSGPAQRSSVPIGQRKPVQQQQVVHHHQQQQQQTQQQQQEEEHQAQICPITGNILGQEDQTQLQAQLVQEQQQLTLQQEQAQQQQLQDIDPNLLLTQDQMLTNEDGTPLLVTGEDGTVYQVAGKNAEGQTILVTQGPDGEQQFAYVAAAEGENENQALTLDNAVAEAVAQLPAEQQAEALAAAAGEGGGQYLVKTTQEDGTTQVVTMTEAELQQHQALAAAQQQQMAAQATSGATNQLCIQTGDGSDGQEANIPAEVVQAELPSPGGTRRVVLLLQDGTFMMTEMHDDEFKALNIAA